MPATLAFVTSGSARSSRITSAARRSQRRHRLVAVQATMSLELLAGARGERLGDEAFVLHRSTPRAGGNSGVGLHVRESGT